MVFFFLFFLYLFFLMKHLEAGSRFIFSSGIPLVAQFIVDFLVECVFDHS